MPERGLRGPEEIHPTLLAAIEAERRGTLVFSVLTVLLTPFFILAVLALLLMGLAFITVQGGLVSRSVQAQSWLATGINIVLAYIFASFFAAPGRGGGLEWKNLKWVGAALGVFAMLLVLSYATNWQDRRPGLFWLTYAVASPAMLAMLGKAFMPKDPYYLGWYESIGLDKTSDDALGNPVSDSLQFAAFLPGLVLECYGQIFGSFWLWRRLDPAETRLMVETLVSLGAGDDAGARDRLTMAPKGSSADALRWLSKLEFVRFDRGILSLTDEGAKFLSGRTV